MSRRFGRNQRRRTREQIDQLEKRCYELSAGMALDRALLRRTTIELEKFRSILVDVTRCLGENFVGLPPIYLADVIVRATEKWQPYRVPSPSGDIVDLHLLHADAHSSDVRNALHCKVSLAGGDAAYAISKKALFTTPADILARRISRELAELLIGSIREAGGR